MVNINDCKSLISPSGTSIYYTGPSLEEGKLPALFYFALSGPESLGLDPYNQPVVALSESAIRVYSITLPFHGPGFENKQAMGRWAQEIEQGHNLIALFIQQVSEVVSFLIASDYIDPEHLAVAGLSRGGFMATHLAAADPRFRFLLGFAPATDISMLSEFKNISHHSFLHALDLAQLIPQLVHTSIRFYIGNRDELVGTQSCVSFLLNLTEAAYLNGIRSPPIELIMTPSIGHKGHGTSPQAFYEGAAWIRTQLSIPAK